MKSQHLYRFEGSWSVLHLFMTYIRLPIAGQWSSSPMIISLRRITPQCFPIPKTENQKLKTRRPHYSNSMPTPMLQVPRSTFVNQRKSRIVKFFIKQQSEEMHVNCGCLSKTESFSCRCQNKWQLPTHRFSSKSLDIFRLRNLYRIKIKQAFGLNFIQSSWELCRLTISRMLLRLTTSRNYSALRRKD